MRTRVGNGAVEVTIAGETISPAGGEHPVVVFVHGFGVTPRSYRASLQRLAEHRTVVALTLPGFGGSDPIHRSRTNAGGVAEHLLGAIDALRLTHGGRRVTLVGHSFGGGVVLEMALRRPAMVDRLVLLTPVGGADEGAANLLRMAASLPREGAGRWTQQVVRDFVDAACRHPVAVAGTAWNAWRACLANDLDTVLDCGVPTHLYLADQDRIVVPGRLRKIDHPLLHREVIRGGHGWPLASPRRFVSLVLAGTTERDLPSAA